MSVFVDRTFAMFLWLHSAMFAWMAVESLLGHRDKPWPTGWSLPVFVLLAVSLSLLCTYLGKWYWTGVARRFFAKMLKMGDQ